MMQRAPFVVKDIQVQADQFTAGRWNPGRKGVSGNHIRVAAGRRTTNSRERHASGSPDKRIDEGPLRGREANNIRRNVIRSEEHTSELQSHSDLVCRLL